MKTLTRAHGAAGDPQTPVVRKSPAMKQARVSHSNMRRKFTKNTLLGRPLKRQKSGTRCTNMSGREKAGRVAARRRERAARKAARRMK